MITIRPEQAAAFSHHQTERFETWMISHLKTCWPEQYANLGEDAMRAMVRDGIGRASRRRFTAERDVCKYIDLMVAFGAGFDQQPWAIEALEETHSQDPAVRMDSLCQTALSRASGGG